MAALSLLGMTTTKLTAGDEQLAIDWMGLLTL
jgi:hypothetical protein